MRPRIAVVGGGIAGLAAAHHLRELDPTIDLLVLESSDRLGGLLQTSRRDGFLIEAAADNFLVRSPDAIDLCQRIGFADALISPAELPHQSFVVHGGRLHSIPRGFQVLAPGCLWPALTTNLLSWRSRLRLTAEVLQSARPDGGDESVAQFAKRHFGHEVYDRLVQPLMTGIYGADPEQLSVRSSLPRFAEMESRYGSVLRGMWAERKAARVGGDDGDGRSSPFMAPREGMSSLVNAIARRLPQGAVQLRAAVQEVIPLFDGGWHVVIGENHESMVHVDGVVLATPATQMARLLAQTCPRAAAQLASIHSTSCAVVSLGYRREQVAHPLNGFGFVVPMVERRCILSCSFASAKYMGRAPEDMVLLRVFIGGGCQPLLSRLCDADLTELAHREVASLLEIRGEPVMVQLARHQTAMPQYDVGHRERIADIERQLEPYLGLALAGNAICGVGIPGCIASAERAAKRALATVLRGVPKHKSLAVPV